MLRRLGAPRSARSLSWDRDRVNAHVLIVVPPLAVHRPRSLPPLTKTRWKRLGGSNNSHPFDSGGIRRGGRRTSAVSAESASPAPVVARVAREYRVDPVGIDTHGAPHRAETADAALHVTRRVDVPVVAVPPNVAPLPRHGPRARQTRSKEIGTRRARCEDGSSRHEARSRNGACRSAVGA